MSIGNYEYYFVPVLEALKKSGVAHRKQNVEDVAKAQNLSDLDLAQTHASGKNVFRGRVHWAQAFLAQAAAIRRPQRGYLEITDRGLKLLSENPNGFKAKKFHEFPDYADAWGRGRRELSDISVDEEEYGTEATPQEKIEAAIRELDISVAAEILQRVREGTPKFLELVVLQLLKAMDYGSSDSSIEHLGGAGDEGVDGVINQDSLGLQRIYVQAKRYKAENTIGRPDLQKFVGALTGLGANGGVFITTSSFSNDAREYSKKNLTPRIVLIDGEELAQKMVLYGIGVQTREDYKIVDIDEDYFEE